MAATMSPLDYDTLRKELDEGSAAPEFVREASGGDLKRRVVCVASDGDRSLCAH